MRISITHKLFLAILAASILAVLGMSLIMQWKLDRGFLRFINSVEQSGISSLAEKLESGYARENSWEFLRRDSQAWQQMLLESMDMHMRERLQPSQSGEFGPPQPMGQPGPPPPPKPFGEPGNRPHNPPPHVTSLIQRVFVLDADRKPLLGQTRIPADNPARELRSNGKVIGYLGLLPRKEISDPFQQRFLKEQKNSFLIVAILVVCLSALLSLLLAARLIRPLRALASATHSLASGDHSVRVAVTSSDEMGRLAEDFNALAATLERNDKARRQWVADISHELRTPLAILRGEIEAIVDGVRQPTPEAVASLHTEVLRLNRLVEDLYQLSLSDVCAMSYRKTELDCAESLKDAIDAFESELDAAGIRLLPLSLPEAHRNVFADPERLYQLFCNLLENSLKYTSPGGTLQIRLAYQNNHAVITFEDSQPGVPPEALDKLFDRLFRVESSRNRSLGGAGLGLSICRNIVEAHGGSIAASPSSLGGLCIKIILPLSGGNA